ncbi:MAG: hypothetical protein ABGZ36_00585 [Actinomycetota bacterium]|uniref:hypothetical protein n=1 Tax=Euzebya pacifica TaxID=1608957 RepID=UPI000DF82034|nr:hypothetical protein [Euzebya pacifica]
MNRENEPLCKRCGRPHRDGPSCGGDRVRIRSAQPQQVQPVRSIARPADGPGDRAAAQQQ